MSVHAHDKLVGRTVGEYILRERIGEGGFGAVYRAAQPALDREAVVKVLHTRLKSAKSITERFLREAKLASKLDHPYAAHIYGFGAEPDGELWIAMELVRGTPLDEILRFQGPMPLERLVPLLDRICEVVHTAHEQGIVHRDLKPANVMVLSRAGRLLPKLLDFGIAKGLAQDPSGPGSDPAIADTAAGSDTAEVDPLARASTIAPALTQRGAVMGSPPYMAPEQWLDAARVDGRTDLYALGVLAYEALSGRLPFSASTVTGFAQAHATQSVPPIGAKLPAALDVVFARVLAKQPEDRFADALAFAQAFRHASGIAEERATLPALETEIREAVVTAAPQPIAEAVANLEAARNPHQARDAVWQIVRTIVRYVGLVAIACRTRFVRTDHATVTELLRTLHRRTLTDREWLELARELTRAWIGRRDAYPLPELVDVFHDADGGAGATGLRLGDLVDSHEAAQATADEDELVAFLTRATGQLSSVLRELGFLSAYPLVVAVAGGVAERWMGVRRAQRTTTSVLGKGLPSGTSALLDATGVPVLVLAPLVQVTVPAPGAPLELFLFEGRGQRGARLVALPAGFQHHDDSLWDWFRAQLSGSLEETADAAADGHAPYRGLSAFSTEDGEVFVGREKLVDSVVNRLRVQPVITVVGRSGAGKSSFVQAGVMPALAGWRALTLRPGPSPIATLLAKLQTAGFSTEGLREAMRSDRDALGRVIRAGAGGPIVIVVDQLEEVFTLAGDAEERRLFLESIVASARSADDPVRVVFTLRDDFLVRVEQMPAMRNLLGPSLQLLAVPAADDLLRILIEPARRAGYEFEDPELPSEMVKEVADQPGALPLLSFTAARLWELRDRHFKQLTRSAYRSLGGVGGALAQHAERTLEAMPAEERRLTRESFRYLVTTQNTRAVLGRRDLRELLGGGDNADAVLEKLVAARLLVTSETEAGDTIEIIHEALLVAWPRLVEWRREDTEGARLREQLRVAARQWDERGRIKGLLWRGDALADYTRWRARHPGPVTAVETAFGDASAGEAARGRRIRRVLLGLTFAVLAAGIAILLTINARIDVARQKATAAQASAVASEAKARAQVAELYEEQGRQRYLAGDPIRALVFLRAATVAGATGAEIDYLQARVTAMLSRRRFALTGHAGAVLAGRYTPDGSRIYTFGEDGTARAWDAHDGHASLTFTGHTGRVFQGEPSPDGTRLATASADNTARIWDTRTGRLLLTLSGHTGWVISVRWSPKGDRVVTASLDGTARVWDASTGAMVATLAGHIGRVSAAMFAEHGQAVVTGGADGTLGIWEPATGRRRAVLRHHTGEVNAIASDAEGEVVASTSVDGTVAVWSVATGKRTQVHDLQVGTNAIALRGDVVAASGGSEIELWSLSTGKRLVVLHGHQGEVRSVTFSPDGAMIASSSLDGTVRLWDAGSGIQLGLVPSIDVLRWVEFSTDGSAVLIGGGAEAAAAWDTTTDVIRRSRAPLGGTIGSLAVTRDGAIVLACDDQGTTTAINRDGAALHVVDHGPGGCRVSVDPGGTWAVTTGARDRVIWDLATGATRSILASADGSEVHDVAVSPDGMLVATAHFDGLVRIWDARRGALVRPLVGHDGGVNAVAWSSDSRHVVTCGTDATARIWDVAEGTMTRKLTLESFCFTTAFSRDGRRVLGASGKSATIWDIETGALELRLDGHLEGLSAAAFTDRGLIVTTSYDGTARLWDARTGRVVDILPHPDSVYAGVVTDTGVLISASGGAIFAWSLTPSPSPGRTVGELPFELREGVLIPREAR